MAFDATFDATFGIGLTPNNDSVFGKTALDSINDTDAVRSFGNFVSQNSFGEISSTETEIVGLEGNYAIESVLTPVQARTSEERSEYSTAEFFHMLSIIDDARDSTEQNMGKLFDISYMPTIIENNVVTLLFSNQNMALDAFVREGKSRKIFKDADEVRIALGKSEYTAQISAYINDVAEEYDIDIGVYLFPLQLPSGRDLERI